MGDAPVLVPVLVLVPFGSIWSFGDLRQWKIMENRYTMKDFPSYPLPR
jgi:hypothetical protein